MSASSASRPVWSSGAASGGLDSLLKVQTSTGSWNRMVFSRIPSTNSVGKRVAVGYLNQGLGPLPTILMTVEQTRGRGRLGREWFSPPGGIYASLILPVEPEVPLSILPMTVPTALCRELDRVLDPPVRLKWPNDLMVRGCKLGGVLIETVGRGATVAVVVGFGVNYTGGLAEKVEGSISVLEMARQAPSLGDLASRLIETTARAITERRSMDEVVEDYSAWSLHEVGQTMHCRTAAGTDSGTFVGFDENGFLRLQTDRGERAFSAGDVIETGETDPHV